MGAADVVPGVSGGTIALITGIYEELIDSLKSINIEAVKLLFKGRIGQFWSKINGSFLVAVFTGILLSVFSLARILKWVLISYPILIWAFFFGLIIASAVIVIRSIKSWDISKMIALTLGLVSMVLITRFSPSETTEAYWFIFISGAIAICAMILPGISGAFILLILGKYQFVLEAVSELNIIVLLVFGLGVISGLLSFANFLSWLLRKYHDLTIAVLAGFIIGSLNKIWPWKEIISTRINSHGLTVPLLERNVLPAGYAKITGNDPQLLSVILLAVAGAVVVILLERLGRRVK